MSGKRSIVLLLCLYSFLFALTVSDFGPSWDSVLGEFYFGDKQLEFWKSLDLSELDLSRTSLEIYGAPGQPDYGKYSAWAQAHPEHIWSLGPTLSALSRELFFTRSALTDSVTAQHIFLLPLVLLLLFELWRFGSEVWNTRVGLFAATALAVSPRFWAHAHNNIKDVPLAVFFSLTVFYGFRLCRRPSRSGALLFGIVWGLALAAKANALFLPLVFALWLLLTRPESRASVKSIVPLGILSGMVGALLFLVLSPSMWVGFPKGLIAQAQYLLSIGSSAGNFFRIMPAVNALVTIPGPLLPFFILGIVVLPRSDRSRSAALLVYLWAFFPIFRASIPRANDFDVVRHWLEVQPAFALIIGVGVDWCFQKMRSGSIVAGALSALIFAPIFYWNVVNHPFNLPYYNFLVGGLKGAQERGFPQATDYWGSSYRKGVEWLNAHADRDAEVFVGVGQHILQPLAPVWLRPDLTFRLKKNYSVPSDARASYVMYITREERYASKLREMDDELTPVYSIAVDGGVILKIIKSRRG